MFKNNLFTTILQIVLISIIILTLPILSFITTYINPRALKMFHFSFLIVILLSYIFLCLFKGKKFFLPMIAFIIVSIIWFIFYGLTQGIEAIIPSFSFVLVLTVINIGLVIPYIILLIKNYNEENYQIQREKNKIYT